MFRIIQFLTHYRNAVLWLFLQLIAMLLMINFNDIQRHAVGDAVLQLSGNVQLHRARIKYYFNLAEENDALKDENLSLHKRLETYKSRLNYAESVLRLDSNRLSAYDTNHVQKQFYTYVPCHAINNTTDKNYNYITLDKGSADGVRVGMGLISPRGIAGRVIRVTKDYSLALSMLSINFTLNAKIRRTGNVGMYEWAGGNSRIGLLNNVPQDVELRIGDSIVTSGYSSIFPEGFILGVIQDNKTIQGGFYKAQIALATNFDALGDLYIVEAKHVEAVDSLKVGLPQE